MEILTPQALADEGQKLYTLGEYLSAAEAFRAAADGFTKAGEESRSAEMANNSSVAYLKAGDASAALQAARGTDEIFSRLGDVRRQALALGNQAAACEKLNQVDEALRLYRQSAERLEMAGEMELRAYVYQAISEILLRKGQYLEAYANMRAGVNALEKPGLKQKLLKTLMDLPFKFLKG